jgi:hypothetical protein
MSCSLFLQSGLLASILTPFWVFTATKLQPDNSGISKDCLLHMSRQISNSSIPAFVQPEISVDPYWVVVNALLSASLILVHVYAFLAVTKMKLPYVYSDKWC